MNDINPELSKNLSDASDIVLEPLPLHALSYRRGFHAAAKIVSDQYGPDLGRRNAVILEQFVDDSEQWHILGMLGVEAEQPKLPVPKRNAPRNRHTPD